MRVYCVKCGGGVKGKALHCAKCKKKPEKKKTTRPKAKCLYCKVDERRSQSKYCSDKCRGYHENKKKQKEKEKRKSQRKQTRKKAINTTKKAAKGANNARKKAEKKASKIWGY